MSNQNTFTGVYGLAANFSSTETAVQSPVGVLGPLGASTSSTALRQLIGLPPDVAGGTLDGQPFKLRVRATGKASGAGNFVVNVYWDSNNNTNTTTFTSDILVIGSGNQALATNTGIVMMEATLVWDSVLKQVTGFWNEAAGISDIVTTPAVIKTSAAVTATNPIASSIATSNLVRFFVTTSISANGTAATLNEFTLERL